MVKVYCYSRCTTCKKALQWLDDNRIEHEVIDIKEDHPDENTSGIPYREKGLSRKLPDMSEEEQLALLATDGMLVKRPLLIGDDFVLTGFKESEWTEKLL